MVASRRFGRRHQSGIRTAPQPIADVLAAAIGSGLGLPIPGHSIRSLAR
jgi:hypothetical protein